MKLPTININEVQFNQSNPVITTDKILILTNLGITLHITILELTQSDLDTYFAQVDDNILIGKKKKSLKLKLLFKILILSLKSTN